ncbi:MAG TPA: hypothetical protein DCZ01_03785 [Elusimicrobia bacterium]|nr:MAG: hypothetical protein A2X37_06250 [Elusimicrobia bacterium GWA2_66_18]HAZ07648.1 hypothetical protein [Elusimicrobiota bacterium]
MNKVAAAAVVGALVLLVGTAAQASQGVYRESFLPENDMNIPVGSAEDQGISLAEFNAVMDELEAIYTPIIAARGGRFIINRLWGNPNVNATATRIGDDYIINMFGGLARHPATTQDSMSLVACHEIGHHLGGAPKYDRYGPDTWVSAEGEADYFATTKCLHRVFSRSTSANFTRMEDDNQIARKSCANSYQDKTAQDICYRSAQASLSATAFRGPVNHFDTPDPLRVTWTRDGHSNFQCRLDTLFQGSLCTKPWTTDLDDVDPGVGACVASQGYKVGLRPRCWYMPPPTEPDAQDAVTIRTTNSRASQSAALAILGNGNVFSGF